MTDWRMRLRDADRALGSEVESETAHRLRRAVVASARASAPRPLVWSRPFVAAAATLALVCVTLITTVAAGFGFCFETKRPVSLTQPSRQQT